MVTQFIKVRNPPSREFVARATMPFPTGTDPSRIGNSFNAPQQHRLIARLEKWDIYEWMVYVPAGTGHVDVSDAYPPPPQRRARRGTLGQGNNSTVTDPSGPIGQQPVEGLFQSHGRALADPAAVRLEFDGPDGTEIVNIAGPSGRSVRAGNLKITWVNHKRTTNYPDFHYWWDITRNDPLIRLTINLHTGIPKREVLLRHIRFHWPANDLSITKEFGDPAINFGTGMLLPPLADPNRFYLFPRMAQRLFRVVFYPRGAPFPGLVERQDAGWGVADWSGGGFTACDLRVPSNILSHVTNLPALVDDEARQDNTNLAAMINVMDPGPAHQGDPPTTVLWPAIGQKYGGPTGSDGKYKPYHGIKVLASNERAGLIKLKIEQLRHHSRDWTAIYEVDGRNVVPDAPAHLDSAGWKQWSAFMGAGYFQQATGGQWHPYTGSWRDAGFGFSAPQFHVQRLPGQRDELQSFNLVQRWDNWDGQHRMLLWAADCALAWLDADPASMLYLVGEAERTRMVQWSGAGQASFTLPPSTGTGVTWGREQMWAMFAIASALPFVLADSPEADDDGSALTPTSRRSRWVQQQLDVFVRGTEKAMMPNGHAWHAQPANKGWWSEPFGNSWTVTGNYYVTQLFEVGYGINALFACYGVKGDGWQSVLGPGRVNVRHLGLAFARTLETMARMGTQTVATAAVAGPERGVGYAVSDIVTVLDDRARGGSAHSLLTAPLLPRLRVDAIDGSGGVTALSVFDAGRVFTQPTEHHWGDTFFNGSRAIVGATWVEATKSLIKAGGGFASYTFQSGDTVTIQSGTGATPGTYTISSNPSNDELRLATSIGAGADGQTDIAGYVPTLSAATWTEATKRIQRQGAFTRYSWRSGDQIRITGGTGATPGLYTVTAKLSDHAITLATSIGAGANGSPDIQGYISEPGALTMSLVTGGSVAAGGTGYLNGQRVSPNGGEALGPGETAEFQLTVSGGVVTGVALTRQGRYLEPPPSPATLPGGNNNATVNLTRSAVGKDLRVSMTYAAPSFAAPGTSTEAKYWKHFPVGPFWFGPFSGATFTHATKRITKVGAFKQYIFAAGQELTITAGTGATVGQYEVAAKVSDDVIELTTSIGAGADGQTNIAGILPAPGRYTSGSDFLPLDICNRSAHANPYISGAAPNSGGNVGQQDQTFSSLANCCGLWGYAALELGDTGGHVFNVAKRLSVKTTTDQILVYLRAAGVNRLGGTEMIENWWPMLAYLTEQNAS